VYWDEVREVRRKKCVQADYSRVLNEVNAWGDGMGSGTED
jgi:hypothetical protein